MGLLNPKDGYKMLINSLSSDFRDDYYDKICSIPEGDLKNSDYQYNCNIYKDLKCLENGPYYMTTMKQTCAWLTFKLYSFSSNSNFCENTWVNDYSLANNVTWKLKRSILDYIIPIGRVLVFIYLSLLAFFFQFWQERYARKLDDKEDTIGEISVLIKGLPNGEKYKDVNIDALVKREFLEEGYKVENVNFIFKCDRYEQIIEELKDLAAKRYKKEFLVKQGNIIEIGLNKVRQIDENEILLAQEKDEQKKQERIKQENELKKEKEEFEKRIARNDPLLLDG